MTSYAMHGGTMRRRIRKNLIQNSIIRTPASCLQLQFQILRVYIVQLHSNLAASEVWTYRRHARALIRTICRFKAVPKVAIYLNIRQ